MLPEYIKEGDKCYPVLGQNKNGKKTDSCPFCDQRHSHGIVNGHRAPHCGEGYEARKVYLSNGYVAMFKDGYYLMVY